MDVDDVFELRGNTRLYEILGVSPDVSATELRRAYHRLAVLYHPDKNQGGENFFKAISFAYQILSCEEQRPLYDTHRLKSHLSSAAKAYNPNLDPNVELTPSELRAFVESLREEQLAKTRVVDHFAQRQAEEMERQREFEKRHPGFSMPRFFSSLDSTHQRSRALEMTSAEMWQRLQASQNLPPSQEEETLSEKYGSASAGRSWKEQLIEEHRRRRQQQGLHPVDDLGGVQPDQLEGIDDTTLKFVKQQGAAPSYHAAARSRVDRGRRFDYVGFVANDCIDGGSVGDAILADALNDYDPHN